MACKHLVYGWRNPLANPKTGKRGMIYGNPLKKTGETAVRPCGNCIDCRLNYSREWAIRCTHEAQQYEQNCVVTLTYADENLPPGGTIEPEHAIKFIKDLKAYEQYHSNKIGIRQYGCAEYGCNDPSCGRPWCKHTMRPHYHILLFNHDFTDKRETRMCLQEDGTENKYYTSDILDKIWKRGATQIMDLNWDTAAYVARYVMKKLKGKDAQEHEQKQIQKGKQLHEYGNKLKEQQIVASRNPGIGKAWYEKYKEDIMKRDTITIKGKNIRPPKYYDRQIEIENIELWKQIKEKREIETKKYIDKIYKEKIQGNHTNNFDKMSRQKAHEKCMEAKMSMLKRGLDET